jgi:hypothetical protein
VAGVTALTIDFYERLFLSIFFEPFQPKLADPRRRGTVKRQIQEAASAASQSIERFFVNQQLADEQMECILAGLASMTGRLTLEQIASAYALPEKTTEELLINPPCYAALDRAQQACRSGSRITNCYSVSCSKR